MTGEHVNAVLQAVTATGAWVAGLLFMQFWRETRDRLFLLFALAFWLLSPSWILLALLQPTDEARPFIYLVRLAAYLLIIGATVEKNLGRGRAAGGADRTP